MEGVNLTYQEALEWIHSRLTFGSRPGLLRVEALLNRLGNPHHHIQAVHIGGTNGKGSTLTTLRCLLAEEGLKVGSFTSPFINYFNERVTINDVPISNEDLVKWVAKLQPLVAEMDQEAELKGITQFEIITALMFAYFAEEQVDVALIEVGLGGRLDSTNVVSPLISGITTIGLDHMDILGESIVEIASQKAGIIKKERPVVTGRIPTEALMVIEQEAQLLDAPLTCFDADYVGVSRGSLGLAGERFDFSNQWLSLKDLEISLIGKHQVDNGAMAIELYCHLAPLLNFPISEGHIRTGLQKTNWSGRFEVIKNQPLVVIDGAHNEPAVEVLVANCQRLFPNRKIHILFSALKTKDVSKMLHGLAEIEQSHLLLTSFDYPKALEKADYDALDLPENTDFVPSWSKTLSRLLKEIDRNDVLLITGSLYFISQIRDFLLEGE